MHPKFYKHIFLWDIKSTPNYPEILISAGIDTFTLIVSCVVMESLLMQYSLQNFGHIQELFWNMPAYEALNSRVWYRMLCKAPWAPQQGAFTKLVVRGRCGARDMAARPGRDHAQRACCVTLPPTPAPHHPARWHPSTQP